MLENIGVATGFPFGPYHYTDVLGPKLGYVPLMIGPAYLGVGYLSWVLATVLAGDVKRGADAFQTFVTPLIGAFIMVLWDLSMDPIGIDGRRSGGSGSRAAASSACRCRTSRLVSDRLRLHAAFRALSARPRTRAAGAAAEGLLSAGGRHVRRRRPRLRRRPTVKSGGENVVDAAGVTWRTGDIFETAAITALLTMMFVVALALVKIVREPDETRRAF